MSRVVRRYSELTGFRTFRERFEYLKLGGIVGDATFGHDRFLNQALYTSGEWRSLRREIIARDNACDLGIEGREIDRDIVLHHMVPLTKEDILERSEFVLNPEFVICCSPKTHRAIHYGDARQLAGEFDERFSGDTCPWKRS